MVFSNAYAFTKPSEQPKGSIDGCTLFWRFLWFGLWRTVLNIFFIFFILAFVIALPIRAVCAFLVGRRLYYAPSNTIKDEDYPPTVWEWLGAIPERVVAIGYLSKEIQKLPRVAGMRVLPIVAICVLAFLFTEAWLFIHVYQLTVTSRLDFNDPGMLFFLAEVAVLVVVFVALGLARSRNSELWQLAALRYKALKEQTCPIIEIVD
jgi:hypothetical protein